MAVKTAGGRTTGVRRTGGVFLSALCFAFLGWVVLLLWSFSIWWSEGFDVAFRRVENLGRAQADRFSEFSSVSVIAGLSRHRPDSLPGSVYWKRLEEKREDLEVLVASRWSRLKQTHFSENRPETSEWAVQMRMTALRTWLLLQTTGHVLFVKLAVLAAALPLFAMAALAGMVDGLNQRAIRKASLGRESTYVFHKTVPALRKGMATALGAWLALPLAVSPSPLFVTVAVLFGLVVSMSASRFKKHL